MQREGVAVWLKVDDRAPRHPKFMRAGRTPDAIALWLSGSCYCCEFMTDGKIPAEAVEHLTWYSAEREAALIAAGLWIKTADGVVEVHDFLQHNRSAAEARADREKTAARVAKFKAKDRGNARGNAVTNGVSNALKNASVLVRDPDLNPDSQDSFFPDPDPDLSQIPPTPATTPATTTWEAYRAAYQQRYGVEPVRNAKINSQIRQLVERLGAEAAPKVAAIYLRHPGARYMAGGHQVGMLLADAEKLHTEMLAGQPINAAAAAAQERSNANPFAVQRQQQLAGPMGPKLLKEKKDG